MTTDVFYDAIIDEMRDINPDVDNYDTAGDNIKKYVKNNNIKELEKYLNMSYSINEINADRILSCAIKKAKIDIIYFVVNKKIIPPEKLYDYIRYTKNNYDIANILIEEGNKHERPTDFKTIDYMHNFVRDPLYYVKKHANSKMIDFLHTKNVVLKNIQLTSEQFEQCKKYIDNEIEFHKKYLFSSYYSYIQPKLNKKTLIEYVSDNVDGLLLITDFDKNMYYPIQQVFSIHENICNFAIFLGSIELLKYSFDQFLKYLPNNLVPRIKYGCLQELKCNNFSYNCFDILNWLQSDAIQYRTSRYITLDNSGHVIHV